MTTYVYRQSWINDFFLCNERARGEREQSDTAATALGTSIHTGIEGSLAESIPFDEALRRARQKFTQVLEESPDFSWVKHTPEQIPNLQTSMLQSWYGSSIYRDLLAHRQDLLLEWPFEFEFMRLDRRAHDLFLYDDRYGYAHDPEIVVCLQGTIDCIDQRTGIIWDWKTAAKEYMQWEKQRWAIQPTVYCAAAQHLFDSPVGDGDWPFNFLVFKKLMSPRAPQVVSVKRGQRHFDFLKRQLEGIVHLQEADLPEWPRNDQHALCSADYCHKWAECKGAHIGTSW